jgi:uncharacterized protein with PIN domain
MDVPTFMVDHMLIKLGKYLRILGYDAEWDTKLRTHELIWKANSEGRIFLSRNKHIPKQYPQPYHLIHVEPTDPVEQLAMVCSILSLDTTGRLFSRCIRCNVELNKIENKSEVKGHVHPNVYEHYDTFYRCSSCGTIFWKGSHVKNTCLKLKQVIPSAPN